MTTLAACDFLDIDTPGIVNRDKMFENEQGFIDAMNGVYASMADADLYGEQLSFGFVDEIAQLYYNDYEANETTLTKTFDLRYRDEDVRPQIDAIWSKAYNTIQQRAGQHLRTRLRNSAAHPRRSADRARLPAFRPAQTLRAQHRTRRRAGDPLRRAFLDLPCRTEHGARGLRTHRRRPDGGLRGARPRSSTSRNTPPPHCWRASATGAATTKRPNATPSKR